MRTIVEDLRLAVRLLRRQRGISVWIIAILAVALGATTSVFSLTYTLLLRPLPFTEPERLMAIPLTVPSGTWYRVGGGDNPWWSYPKFELYRSIQRSFQDLAIYAPRPFTLSGTGDPERVTGEGVGRYLATLRIAPALGSDFTRAEDDAGAFQRTAIISDALWKRRFAADPRVIGTVIGIDGKPTTISGVLPPGVHGLTGQADVFVPLRVIGSPDLEDAGSHFLEVVGRLAAGVTQTQANDEAHRLGAQIDERYPVTSLGRGWGARAYALDAARSAGAVKGWLVMLVGAVALVLAIACANVANLLLARAVIRQREIAIRMAVGGSRARIVRQLLAESALLSLLGGVVGLALAWAATRGLATLAPIGIARNGGSLAGLMARQVNAIGINVWVTVFCVGLATLTTCAFGILPALRATQPAVSRALKAGGARGGSGRTGSLTGSLVAAEVGLTVVLLAASGLVLRSLAHLVGVDPGIDVTNVISMRISAPAGLYAADSLPGFYGRILDRTSALPGVQSAAVADCPPITGGCNVSVMWYRGGAHPSGERGLSIGTHFVSGDWLRTLRVRLVRGRWFGPMDRLGQPKVVVINETAAHRYWPNEDPLGQVIGVGMAGFNDGATVIGVVGDVYFVSPDSLPRPDVYLPLQQAPRSSMVLFVRTGGDPSALMTSLRGAIRQVDSRLPVYDVRTMADRFDETTAGIRLTKNLLAVFAAIALLLSLFGVYSVTAYAVAQSTREIGIRAALGATPTEVLRAVFSREARYVLLGVIAGLVVAAWVTRAMRAMLFGVAAIEPVVFGTAAVLILVVGALASAIPARRALRVDPVQALASE
jgi:predicted permease